MNEIGWFSAAGLGFTRWFYRAVDVDEITGKGAPLSLGIAQENPSTRHKKTPGYCLQNAKKAALDGAQSPNRRIAAWAVDSTRNATVISQ